MQHTFVGVRVLPLVRVGSGAPSAASDLRLGHVVVSTPAGDPGGVVQFTRVAAAGSNSSLDLSRSETDDGASDGDDHGAGKGRASNRSSSPAYVRTRCLDRPPHALLTAVASLQAEHGIVGSAMNDLVAQVTQQYPKLRTRFSAPLGADGTVDDRLYRADFAHVGGGRTSACEKCGDDRLVRRPRRDDDAVTVHNGTIASGDEEIRCARTRDRAASELDVLCFEREAAGLMDNFPCLVVRGICDHADS